MAILEIDLTTDQEALLRNAAQSDGLSLRDLAVRRLLGASSPEIPAEEPYVRAALDLYRDTLQADLEPQFNGQIVAIHPDSGDHLVEKSAGRALRAMRMLHATGKMVLRTIGPVTESDLGWPPGFFAETAGAWHGDLVREDQGQYEVRESLD